MATAEWTCRKLIAMFDSPLRIAGFALLGVGFLLVATQIFGHGGWAKFAQFRVLGELLRGVHGRRARLLLALGLVAWPIGMCVTFAGVGAADSERAARCETYCKAMSYTTSRIGPNSDRDPNDRNTWFVACICEGVGKPAREIRAR